MNPPALHNHWFDEATSAIPAMLSDPGYPAKAAIAAGHDPVIPGARHSMLTVWAAAIAILQSFHHVTRTIAF